MKTSDIKGIIPPVITPMNDDAEQTVNHEELRKQVERLRAVCMESSRWAPTAKHTPFLPERKKKSSQR